jgi:hypothetical protein
MGRRTLATTHPDPPEGELAEEIDALPQEQGKQIDPLAGDGVA